MTNLLKFGPPPATSMKIEYSGLECAIEVVDDIDDAISHIHKYGSAHTDTVITENRKWFYYYYHYFFLIVCGMQANKV